MPKRASSGDDRRKSPRVKLSFAVTCSFEDPRQRYTVTGEAQAVNVSSEGVCLRFKNPVVLLHGAPMNLTLNLPKRAHAILAKGEVQWSEASNGGTHTGVLIAFTKGKKMFEQSIYGGNGARKKGK